MLFGTQGVWFSSFSVSSNVFFVVVVLFFFVDVVFYICFQFHNCRRKISRFIIIRPFSSV